MSIELLRQLRYDFKEDITETETWLRREAARARRAARAARAARAKDLRRRRRNDAVAAGGSAGGGAAQTTAAEGARSSSAAPSRISAEWSGATGGPPAEVVLRLHPATPRLNLTTVDGGNSGIVVRAEEALIVSFVLLLWVAAIALFFNRWGKIRMLEPYQPKFQQQHRQSCALVDNVASVPPHHRPSLSRGCMSYECGTYAAYQPCGYLAHRPRQNSVFVGSMGGMALIPESPPRRSRSAADLPALALPPDHSHATPRSSRAASLHSAVDVRLYVPSPRASRAASLHSTVDMGSVQVHVRGSNTSVDRQKSPRRLTITNV